MSGAARDGRGGDAPVGLMLAAAPYADDALLAIGRGVEAVLAPLR